MPSRISWLGCALCAAVVCVSLVSAASADDFGSGANQFTIDFVTISGDAGDLGSWPAGNGYTFTGVNRDDYRIGTYEITNDQWDKFKAELGVPVTGNPSNAYNESPYFTGENVPTNEVSWYEAAQFVNWLNTSTGHQAAYKFTGTQGQSDYALATWSSGEADGTNLYRHKDAFYYLPTEDEWVKAGYWNGTSLQTYSNASPGDLVSGIPDPAKWNWYPSPGFAALWNVGSGVQELNGTFHMMGNVWEWMESPYSDTSYGTGSSRGLRGGSFHNRGSVSYLASSIRSLGNPSSEDYDVGFRVASEVPEPASMSLLAIGGLALIKRRRR